MPGKTKVSNIWFHEQQKSFYLSDRSQLKHFIREMFNKEAVKYDSLRYIFCSDDYLLQINRRYLKHNYYTDIITFNLADSGHPAIGEIYISTDRVKENAKKLGLPYYKELHRVVFHGALHLCGYRDKSTQEIAIMRKKEDLYLQIYFM